MPFFGAGSGVLLDCSPSRSAFSLRHFLSVDEFAASASLHRPKVQVFDEAAQSYASGSSFQSPKHSAFLLPEVNDRVGDYTNRLGLCQLFRI